MHSSPEPEIIPPGARPFPRTGSDPLTDESLEQLASVLDDIFQIPGTRIRFGLDPLIGLIPGLGDTLTGLISFLIVTAAWRRGVPRVTIARMVANIALDTLAGSIPFAGGIFDFYWKSNRRNLDLLKRARIGEAHQTWRDWLFLGIMGLVIAGLVVLPFVVAFYVFRWLF
jgi:hypothetical protein